MFKLKLRTTERREIIANEADKVMDVLAKEEVSIQGATVALSGRVLDTPDLSCTFAELGVQDGAEEILSVVAKVDSAAV